MTTFTTRLHLFEGCQPSPVLSYLKGLGILRLVAEQADPQAAGAWSAHGFRLRTSLSRDELETFFLNDYAPTPIVSPWNGRSGFFTESYNRDSEKLLVRLAASDDPRLSDLRAAIAVGQQLHREGIARGWMVPDEKGKLKVVDKAACIAYCRNRFPDSGVAWLDAVAALASEGPAFSILLGGSGGNLGSLDLSNNLYQHLVTLLMDDGPPRAASLLADALTGSASAPAVAAKIGQLDPGRAGGVGRQRDDDTGMAATWVNPWDYVLALEGSLVFASAIARRVGREGAGGRSAMPFTVASSPAGARGGAENETVRGEVWVPLWHRPATFPELSRLFGEARVQWDGRQAATSTDFAAAVVNLGADRGLDAFQRITVAQRLGQASLSAPVGRVTVTERPEVRTTVTFDRWLRSVETLSRPPAPSPVLAAVRRARQAQYRLAERGGAALLTDFLTAVAAVEITISRSGAARKRIRPVLGPLAEDVLPSIQDGTAETAIGLALASLRDAAPRSAERDAGAHSLRTCLRPVELLKGRWQWLSDGSAPVTGLDTQPLSGVLADVLALRSTRAAEHLDPEADVELRGAEPWFRYGWRVPSSAAEAFAAGRSDNERIRRLLCGFLVLDWEYSSQPAGTRPDVGAMPVPAHRLLAGFFSPRPLQVGPSTVRLRPAAGWARLLTADRVEDVVANALERLRGAGLRPTVGSGSRASVGQRAVRIARRATHPLAAGVRGPDLAAAALLHLRSMDYLLHLQATTQPLPTDGHHS